MKSGRRRTNVSDGSSAAKRRSYTLAVAPSRSQRLDHQHEQKLRLMCVAVETASRFVRERRDLHAMEWLLTPQRVFDNRAAIDACCEAEGFRRAMLLHGLDLDLDTASESLASVPLAEVPGHGLSLDRLKLSVDESCELRIGELGPLALYSCSISSEIGHQFIQIFCAMIARHPDEVRHRLRCRFGQHLESEAQVRLGFDWSEPIATALVSEATADMLLLVAQEPTSSLAEGLDYQVEQRFAS